MIYRKKPVEVKAIQWDGSTQTLANIHAHLNQAGRRVKVLHNVGEKLLITTLEGEITASVGDYIIEGVAGELYPCKPAIFDETYEPVDQ